MIPDAALFRRRHEAWWLLAQLCNKFDLDAGAQRDLGDTEGASGVLAEVSENFTEKFGSAIGDEMLLGEGRCAVHQHH